MAEMMTLDQRTDEWLQARCGKITASRASDVLSRGRRKDQAYGESWWTYFYQLAGERMTGRYEKPTWSQTHAIRRGIELEPVARTAYELATGNDVRPCGFLIADGMGNVGCSPDGQVGEEGIVEFKCPLLKQHIRNVHRGMDSYLPQVLFQLGVAGGKWCDLVSYTDELVGEHAIKIVRVFADANADAIEALMDRVIEMDYLVDEYVAGGTVEWE